jgi:hypothetical protein
MANPLRLAACSLALLLAAILSVRADDAPKPKEEPLSEAALVKLAKAGIEGDVIAVLVKKRGVAFKTDDATIERLKKGGLPENVLAAVRPAAGDPKLPKTAGAVLGAGKHDDGLIVEVIECKPTKNEELMVRWRYRNPTRQNVELVAQTPAFAVGAGATPPNVAKRFLEAVFYKEGKFESGAVANHYIIAQGSGRLNATDLGKKAIVIRPDKEFEMWAIFTLPKTKSKTEKTISLFLLGTSPIKNIPVQSVD